VSLRKKVPELFFERKRSNFSQRIVKTCFENIMQGYRASKLKSVQIKTDFVKEIVFFLFVCFIFFEKETEVQACALGTEARNIHLRDKKSTA